MSTRDEWILFFGALVSLSRKERMREPDDWRLRNQERYLKGVVLSWAQYHPANPGNDHDHCEFCFSKLMEGQVPDTLQTGYTTQDRYRWVCKACFEDFKRYFSMAG